jgi:hypothetical protein
MDRAAILAFPGRIHPATRLQRSARWVLRVAGAALALFHAGLLAGRLADASIVEPRVGLRWATAALLGALALTFRRHGLPLARGRSGLVFWLLALLLHVGAAPAPTVVRPEELLLALPVGAVLALAVGCGLTAAGCARRTDPAYARVATNLHRRRPIPPLARRSAPRPPPVA